MIVVTVVEKYKGRVVFNTYEFKNETEYKKFVELSKDFPCVLIERKQKNFKEESLNMV